MKLLLDESLPRDLALHLSEHEVRTVPDQGWAAMSNGELLRVAGAEFDAFLTADQNLEHQQNIPQLNLAVVVLVARSNRLHDLLPLVSRVLELLPDLEPGRVARVAA